MTRRRRATPGDPLARLVADTDSMVARLIGENRALRARNLELERRVEQLSEGWDVIRRLARAAPRRRP